MNSYLHCNKYEDKKNAPLDKNSSEKSYRN